MYHNFSIKSKDNTVICVPGCTAGHLDAYSATCMVPKAHMGHLVPCSAAADLSKSSYLVNNRVAGYNTSDNLLSCFIARIHFYLIYFTLKIQTQMVHCEGCALDLHLLV